jgi:bifunctional N-acetylglucosamine-1-phosphate-uridyltransferase/glucosamine-1-phosphate-acetyltransferase GlmU-like protein
MTDIMPYSNKIRLFSPISCRRMSSPAAPVLLITQDVPADSLALGRSRQVVKEGWATRLRGLKALRKKKA